METLDELVEAILDVAREERIDDARIIIRDRIEKHVKSELRPANKAKEQ